MNSASQPAASQLAASQLETSHLSDEQLDDLLLGDAPPATLEQAALHLVACAPCRQRQEAFEAPLLAFNQASLAWSEARSLGLTRDLAAYADRSAQPSRFRFLMVPALALAAVLLFLLAVFHTHVPVSSQSARVVAQASPAANSPASDAAAEGQVAEGQIAKDNLLLAQIDSALDQPDPSPLVLYQQSSFEPSSRHASLTESESRR